MTLLSVYRHSPDGNLNPGTPGASHEYHKFPNSPWSGSEPATPGSGYSRNVVPSSPYVSSYPNTPATPGGGGFYQKPVANGVVTMNPGNGNAAVPPGSPWTDRSVCTPGPLTPMTPATPMHSSSMSDHGSSNGSFGNSGSPTFPLDNNNPINSHPHSQNGVHNGKPQQLAQLLQQDIPKGDSMQQLPVTNQSTHQNVPSSSSSQMNHNIPVHNSGPSNSNNSNTNAAALPSTLPPISDADISQVVYNNPNL